MPSTWTTADPQGTTKIRMAPTILQDRWINIEQGEVPSDKWQLQRQAIDPTSIASTGLIYTKDGGSGISELYYKDDAGTPNITRLTNAGGIGAYGQKIYGNEIVLEQASGFGYSKNALISACGRVTSGGSLATGSFNVSSVSGPSSSEYTVNYTTPLVNTTDYGVICSIITSGGSTLRVAVVTEMATTYFKVKTYTNGGSLSDAGFGFIVVGGRPGE